MEPEREYHPGMAGEELEKGRYRTPEKRVKNLSETEWGNSINQLFFNQERAKEILDKTKPFLQHLENLKENETPSPAQAEIIRNFHTAQNYLQDINQHANALFSRAYKYGKDEQKNELKKLSEQFKKELEDSGKGINGIYGHAQAMQNLLTELKNPLYIPEMWVPLEDFATEKSAESFGNAAWQAYKKLKGKNIPILTIENPPAGYALSTGEDVRKVVEASREKFIENAVAGGLSQGKAREEAEKLIGATWDVGHINMLRKYGYSEKEIIKEAEQVAPLIKHVHLSDNFGFEHTELPMGMGNVPLKEIMEKLGQKGYDAKKIIEAGHWWQHFKTQPFQETLEAVGSPIYGMKMAPYWSWAPDLSQGYFGGYGQMLPQINYETFGAGFSRLPAELGGQNPSAQGSRMSGRQME